MDDLISRQAAIDALGERHTVWTTDGERRRIGMRKYIDPEAFFKVINTLPYKDTSYPDASAYNGAISDVADMLAHFPAADVEPRWIPVAEALPTQYGNYFVTMRNNAFGYWQVDIATFSPKYDNWSSCDADGFYFIGEKGMAVIAWMPLPEPYKGGEEE